MKVLMIGFVFLICFSFSILAQEANKIEITAHLEGLKDGEVIKLGHRFGVDWHVLTWVDSCVVHNGEFHLKTTALDGGPRNYEICFFTHKRWDTTKTYQSIIGGDYIEVFADKGDKIKIRGGDINQMHNSNFTGEVAIEGSPSHLARASLLPFYNYFSVCYEDIDRRINKIRDSIGFDRSAIQEVIKAKMIVNEDLKMILSNAHPYYVPPYYRLAIPSILSDINDFISPSHFHAAFLPELYRALDDVSKNSFYGKKLKDNSRLSIGQPMPNFTLPTPDGKMISLNDFAAKNKLTLVHFWATNSFERKNLQEELKILYKKYHGLGLDIIAVSSDSLAKEWKAKLIVEEYPWINVSDLKGNVKGGIVADVYHEAGNSMPNTTNVLLDHEGRIIAWDAYGPELQWYLWKYLENK